MKLILTALFVLSLPFTVQARPVMRYSQQYTCEEMQTIIERNGEALVYSEAANPQLDLSAIVYQKGCPAENAGNERPYWAPAEDSESCFIGYVCTPVTPAR